MDDDEAGSPHALTSSAPMLTQPTSHTHEPPRFHGTPILQPISPHLTLSPPLQTNSLWSFNAPVDCVNGYNCPTAPMTLAQRQAAAAGRRLEEGKAAWDNMVEGVAKGIKTALKAATDGLKTPETEAKDTLRSVEGLHAGMVNISGS